MADSTSKPRCGDCGKFIGANDICASRCEVTPLNEFGPEEVDWTCPRCIEKERASRVCRG